LSGQSRLKRKKVEGRTEVVWKKELPHFVERKKKKELERGGFRAKHRKQRLLSRILTRVFVGYTNMIQGPWKNPLGGGKREDRKEEMCVLESG